MTRSQISGTFVIAAMLLVARPAAPFYNIKVGDPLEDVQLKTLSGKVAHLAPAGSDAYLFVFFRPDQDQALKTLTSLAELDRAMAKKKVHVVAIVADIYPTRQVQDLVNVAGLRAPVLVDVGNQLYGKLGVILTPSAGVADKHRKLAAYLPFRQVNYELIIKSHVQRALGEITQEQLEAILNPAKVKEPGDDAKAQRNLKLGEILYKSKKYDKAAEIALKSIEYSETYAAAHGLLAASLAQQGDCSSAAPEVDKALTLDAEEKYALEARTLCAGQSAAPATPTGSKTAANGTP